MGEPLPRLFSPITVEKRFDAAAVVPYHPIAQISRRSAQDDLLKWGDICYFARRGDSQRFRRKLVACQAIALGPSGTPVPTGLIVIFIFVCRGGYYPPVFLVFKKTVYKTK